MEVLSLYELNNLVRFHVENAMPEEYWVRAELSDIRNNASGHCFLELIEKDVTENNLTARARAIIWSQTYRFLRAYFEQETGQALVSGLKVLVKVVIGFHELYGYSLSIIDIDPSYTIGDIASHRKEIIHRLQEEGVFTLNKELPLPILLQRIAVISSATAAGYEDFCNQLLENPYGYVFYTKLFPALMQGEQAECSIINALNKIYKHSKHWDVVVIIRGGGAVSDLSCFDSYLLATNCAQFPIPIITGIGHERDNTVIDLVAHTRVKTPTAVAEFLINQIHATAMKLDDCQHRITENIRSYLKAEETKLSEFIEILPRLFSSVRLREEQRILSLLQHLYMAVQHQLQKKRQSLDRYVQQLPLYVQSYFSKEQHRLQLLEQQIRSSSPEHMLSRGYSITLKDGKAVLDAATLKKGDVLLTRLAKGKVKSTVS